MKKASVRWRVVWFVGLILLWLLCSGSVLAGTLSDRLAQFPDWQTKPPVQSATGDLVYPDWLAGEWTVTTTLLDMAAPLAPEIITPGFESNEQYLNQPITFQVRFVEQQPRLNGIFSSLKLLVRRQKQVVADRAFNGQNLAEAYLGDRTVLSVRVDPNNPNRQITLLQGDRQLSSTVTGRATESPDPDQFITTEVFQQMFRGAPQLYFNEVETTTAYQRHDTEPTISADQVTAIYLSPQDPDYFKVGDIPVALYRYRLEFSPVVSADSESGELTNGNALFPI
jgi:hypothetical protein